MTKKIPQNNFLIYNFNIKKKILTKLRNFNIKNDFFLNISFSNSNFFFFLTQRYS